MKSFIIYLSKIENSRFFAKKLLQDLRSVNIEANLFEGTYGLEAIEIFEKENRKVCDLLYKGRPISGSEKPGHKGCFYSHYRLWQKCLELNEPIMIFEDDVKLYRGYEEIEFQDVLMISVCTEWKISKPFLSLLEDSDEPAKALPYDGECMIGTSGYIIKPHAAKKLLDTYHNSYSNVDHCMNQNVIKIEIHNKLMGRSLTELEGKKSLTK
jgi:glycosyl transferase family 25